MKQWTGTPLAQDKAIGKGSWKWQKQAFSLVELMIVVAIIGILAALAIPRFQQFQAKARQAEARSNLVHIYTLQISYNGDNDTFSNMDCLTLGTVTPQASGAEKTACGNIKQGAWADVNACNTTNEIGFRITDCQKVRYLYTIKGSQNQFTATASEIDAGAANSRRVFPGCSSGSNDEWQINENKALYNYQRGGQTALQSCKD